MVTWDGSPDCPGGSGEPPYVRILLADVIFEAEPHDVRVPADAGEVLNYVRAAEFGLEQIRAGDPFSLSLLRELHRILFEGVRSGDKRPGEVRERGVLIGRTGHTYDSAPFVPPCHTALPPLLTNL